MSVEWINAKNKEIQSDEYEALSAIYDESFHIVEQENRIYSICVTKEYNDYSSNREITLQFQHVPGYPYKEKLKYHIRAPWLNRNAYNNLRDQLDHIVDTSVELPVVHLIVEAIQSFLQQPVQEIDQLISGEHSRGPQFVHDVDTSSVPPVRFHLQALPNLLSIVAGDNLDILHGDPVIDRKSVFQAHCAKVQIPGEVSLFISTLLSDRKVAAATHNILAWRLQTPSTSARSGNILADCDDDGESHAGSRLLHLLNLADVRNVAVMVSRWYGGIQLGPDRFKHINNVARQLLNAHDFLAPNPDATDRKSSKKKARKNQL